MSNLTTVYIAERVVIGKRLGRHVQFDERSRAFAAPHALGPLKSVIWPRHCDPYDQGDIGSCTGNAMAGALMTGPLYAEGRDLKEEDAVLLYERATRLDSIPGHYPPEDTGSSGLAVAKSACQMGFISAYHHAFGIDAALHALDQGPVIAGINWYEGFDQPVGDSAELVLDGAIRGGHEIVLDGLDIENGFVHGTNSWGTGWGNVGRFVVSFGTLKTLLNQRGDIVVPVRRIDTAMAKEDSHLGWWIGGGLALFAVYTVYKIKAGISDVTHQVAASVVTPGALQEGPAMMQVAPGDNGTISLVPGGQFVFTLGDAAAAFVSATSSPPGIVQQVDKVRQHSIGFAAQTVGTAVVSANFISANGQPQAATATINVVAHM